MPPHYSDASLSLPPHLARKNKGFLTAAPKDKPAHKLIVSLVDARIPYSPYLLTNLESTSSLALPTTGLSTSAATSSPFMTTTSLSGATHRFPPRQTRKVWASNDKDCDAPSQHSTVSMNNYEDTAAHQVPDTNHQLKPTTVMGQTTSNFSRTRAWSRKVTKSLESHPKSKVLREAWKRRTPDVQPESPVQIEIDNGVLLESNIFTDVPAQVAGEEIPGVELPELTTTVTTSSSEATATAIAESASTSLTPLVGAQPQSGQAAWRIIRLGPSPPPARLQTISAPGLEGAASPEKNNSALAMSGKENKASTSVSAAPSRRSKRILKKRAGTPKRIAHPGSSGSVQGVDSASAA